jgi:hypothetical protein
VRCYGHSRLNDSFSPAQKNPARSVQRFEPLKTQGKAVAIWFTLVSPGQVNGSTFEPL